MHVCMYVSKYICMYVYMYVCLYRRRVDSDSHNSIDRTSYQSTPPNLSYRGPHLDPASEIGCEPSESLIYQSCSEETIVIIDRNTDHHIHITTGEREREKERDLTVEH
jgi:hypothetical protein